MLGEKPILIFSDLYGSRALLIIIRHGIDPHADWIAPHQANIVGLQQIGRRTYIAHPRIEPEVVIVRIKNDWHAVVDG